MTENHNAPAGLLLSMQILYEKLKEREIPVSLLPTNEEPCLTGIQFYTGQQELSQTFLYLADCKTLSSHPFLLPDGFLAVAGEPAKRNLPRILQPPYISRCHVPAGNLQYSAADICVLCPS